MKKRSTRPKKNARRAAAPSAADLLPADAMAALAIASAIGLAVQTAQRHDVGLPIVLRIVEATWQAAKKVESEARVSRWTGLARAREEKGGRK